MAFARKPPDEKDFTHEAFAGLRNNVAKARFELTDLDAGLNIDLDDTGRAQRRDGYGSRILAGNCHSIGPGVFSRCFVVSGTVMYEILQDFTTVALVTGLTPSLPVTYFVSQDRCYWSNGVQKGCIEETGNRSWGLEVPPRISGAVGSGTLMTGRSDNGTARYQFSMIYLRKDNQESGAPGAGYVDVPDNGGIVFNNLPVSTDPTVDRKAIYISEPNGEKLFLAMTLSNSTTSAIYRNRGRMVLPLRTMFMGPPPLGTVIGFHGGSMLIGVDNRLHYSEPFSLELFDPLKYKLFATRVNIICGLDDGVHVGTEDMHVWLVGDTPDKYEWKTRANYGAIRGTLDQLNADSAMFGKRKATGQVGLWASKEGLVIGASDGTLENLTRDRFLYPVQERGTGIMRKANGVNQFITILQGTETPAPSFQE